jgi:hypothetical protein
LPREVRGGAVQLHFDRDALPVFTEFQGSNLAHFCAAIFYEGILFLQPVGVLKRNRHGRSGENDVLGDKPGAQNRGGDRNEPQKPAQIAFAGSRLWQIV